MRQRSRYTLQRKMIIYFLLIGFASLFVGVEFVVDTHGPELETTLISNFEKHMMNQMTIDSVFDPIDKLRNKAILMIAIILFVMVIVLTMFIKNITEPLQYMIEVAGEISNGDLSKTITISADNELAELGNVINEMSSNLQEMILLAGNMCSSGEDFVSKTAFIMESRHLSPKDIHKVGEEVEQLKAELASLREATAYFNFYTVDK